MARRRRGAGRASGVGGFASTLVALLVGSVLVGVGSAPTPALGASGATGVVPDAIVSRYLTRRPGLGPVTVAQISGESAGGKLLAATLQGIANRDTAQLYLVGARPVAEDQYWLDDYTGRGLVTVGATGDLDAALAAFAPLVSGYVVASDAEPWTINTATSVAAAEGGVVATPDQVARLQAVGLTQLDDHRGRWPDAATAYEAIAATYRTQLAYPGLAIQQPWVHAPRDFFVQQEVMTVYTRPSAADDDRVYALLDPYPVDHPVYGYVSDTGAEEVEAVSRLAAAGRYLVPTDTTDNLSFHVAVAADRARATPTPATADVEPCTTDTVNVVLAYSDGDNMVVPETRYPTGGRWGSPLRGSLPLGWGIGASASVLMPSIWDHYVTTATDADEIVDMMGLGYTITTLMPDAAGFFAASFTLDAALGIETHWSLDAFLSQPDAPGWANVSAGIAASGHQPHGMLLNYLDFGGPDWHHAAEGFGVLNSRQHSYDDAWPELQAQIAASLLVPPGERPLVSFYAVTAWSSSVDELVAALLPFEEQGVRFLTPSEAFACLPEPPPMPPTTTSTTAAPGTSSTSGPVVPVVEPSFAG